MNPASPPAAGTPPHAGLIDSFGRRHNNLRISATDRCNLRCSYCMPEEMTFLPRDELLRFEEIVRFVEAACELGIDRVRITGGEPLLRKGIAELVAQLHGVAGVRDLSLTTNGLLLADHARALHAAGLRRLNISLDTLSPERFRAIARRDGLDKVLAGIEAAREIGFTSVKVNAVIMRGINEEDIVPLARLGRDQGVHVRYIEYMPIGAEPWERHKAVLAHEILELLEREIAPLNPAESYDPRAPAMEFAFADGRGVIGMIASISRPFCQMCNRIRLTAEGKLRNCLFALDEHDVKPCLRPALDRAALAAVIRATIAAKGPGHEINSARFVKPSRTMHSIGG